MKQVEYLPIEELLKRLVSLEFNRFLNYYKNSEDLNVLDRSSRDNESGDKTRGRRSKRSGERVRLKINLGNKHGLNPKRFLGIINEVTDDKSINIGSIEITNNFTFFDVFEDQKDKLLRAFDGVNEMDVSVAKGSKSFGEKSGRKVRNFEKNGKYADTNREKNEEKPWRNRERSRVERNHSKKWYAV